MVVDTSELASSAVLPIPTDEGIRLTVKWLTEDAIGRKATEQARDRIQAPVNR